MSVATNVPTARIELDFTVQLIDGRIELVVDPDGRMGERQVLWLSAEAAGMLAERLGQLAGSSDLAEGSGAVMIRKRDIAEAAARILLERQP